MIHYEDYERERLDPIYDTIAPYSVMQKNERYFINGMIRYFKPKKILEVGVLNGGGSAIILNAIRDIDGAMLYSADYSEVSWYHRDKPSGFLVEEAFPNLMDKWRMFRGGDVSRYLEEIGGDIDLLVLDTVHVHPWETLNFLCVLPFMKTDSWCILHDVSTEYLSFKWRNHLACRYLFGHVVAEEKIYPVSSRENAPANIGAFRISDNTMKYSSNLFESLLIPWGIEVSPKDYADVKKIIEKYYTPEQYKFFCDVPAFQELLRERTMKDEKSFVEALRDSLRNIVKTYHPGFYSVLHRIKHPFRG